MRLWGVALLPFAAAVCAGEAEDMLERVRQSVVTVQVFGDDGRIDGEGSGVVIGKGRVATNCHVLRDAAAIRIKANGKDFEAKWALADDARDLCVLEAAELQGPAAIIRRSAEVEAGERAYAVGNPLGLGLSVSSGLVAKVGKLSDEIRVFATAPVSPGNSGGGLFDARGRLIGITTRILGLAQNFNEALPAEWLDEIAARAVAPPWPVPTVKPDPRWIDEAQSLHKEKDWSALAAHARRWRTAYRSSAEALTYLGLALLNLHDSREAREVLIEATSLDPTHALAFAYLSMVRERLGSRDQAYHDIRRAIELEPANGYYWGVLSGFQNADGQTEAAIKSVQAVLTFKPGDAEYWFFLGTLLQKTRRPADAIKAYRTALRLRPELAAARSMLAGLLAEQGETDAARKALAAAPEKPGDAMTWIKLGAQESDKGRYAEAERAYRKAIELDPASPYGWHNLGLTLWRTNRMKEAEEAVRESLKRKADFAAAWAALGELLDRRGEGPAAVEALEKATSLDPTNVMAWRVLGARRYALNDLPGAEAAYKEVAARDEKSSDERAILGDIRRRLGRADEALATLVDAERKDSQNAATLEALAIQHGTRADYQNALAYAERALAIDPTLWNAWNSKGYSLLKMGRAKEATEPLETAIRLKPEHATSWINLGEALLRQQELRKSIAALERAIKLAPRAVDARFFAAQAYLAIRQNDRASIHVDAMLRESPDSPSGLYMLTVLHLAQGQREEAVSAYRKLQSVNPAMARDLRERGARHNPAGIALPE